MLACICETLLNLATNGEFIKAVSSCAYYKDEVFEKVRGFFSPRNNMKINALGICVSGEISDCKNESSVRT